MDELIERVAAAMYEAPDPDDPEETICPWPPTQTDDRAWWISRAQVAIRVIDATRFEALRTANLAAFEAFAADATHSRPHTRSKENRDE